MSAGRASESRMGAAHNGDTGAGFAAAARREEKVGDGYKLEPNLNTSGRFQVEQISCTSSAQTGRAQPSTIQCHALAVARIMSGGHGHTTYLAARGKLHASNSAAGLSIRVDVTVVPGPVWR